MAWTIVENRAGLPNIGVVNTVKEVPLGTRVKAFDPARGEGEFIYLAGVASTGAGDAVTYELSSGATTRALANAIGPVGIATAATVASTFGWYQIYGSASCLTANTVADNGNVYVTATAGALDDAVVAGDRVHGALFRGARTGAGAVDIQLFYPYCTDIAD